MTNSSKVDLACHFITILFHTTQLVCSTRQIKLPNATLHHNSEKADLKYICGHWKYEQFFKTKDSWKL